MDLETLISKTQPYRTTPALVADVLREAILSGALKSGQSLRQDEIATKFGVSRIPIREALRQLEGEGLVVSYPHRGSVVASLSQEELLEICEIRCSLETLALRLAIPHMTEATFQSAEEILVGIEREKNMLAQWSDTNWRFHATLYTPARRPRLLAMIKLQHTLIERYLRMHVSLLKYEEQGTYEHREILEACRTGANERAIMLLEHHIRQVGELLAVYLRPEQEGLATPSDSLERFPLSSGRKADAS